MIIAMKEADETSYWFELCKAMESYPNCDELIPKIEVIKKVFGKIIISTSRPSIQ